jgi:TPR repeat protein
LLVTLLRLRTYIVIAILTLSGLGVATFFKMQSQDKAQSASLLALADKGDVDAQYEIARRYEGGKGLPQSFPQAARYYNLAAHQGHSEALTRLHQAHDICARHSVTTVEEAHACLMDAEIGDTNAQIQVGVMYMKGDFLKKEPVFAVPYFDLAAIHGDPRGQMMMSIIYSGKVLPFNPVESYAWTSVVAERKDLPDIQKGQALVIRDNLRKIILRDFGQQTMAAAEQKANSYRQKYGNLYSPSTGEPSHVP